MGGRNVTVSIELSTLFGRAKLIYDGCLLNVLICEEINMLYETYSDRIAIKPILKYYNSRRIRSLVLVRFVGKSESMFKKTLSNNTMKIIQSTTIDPS